MKKIISIAMIGVLVLSGLGAVATNDDKKTYTISESITFSEPVVRDNGKYVTIELEESTSRLMGESKPDMPVVTKVYTFPMGTEIEKVQVTFSETYEQMISKDVKPASVPRYISTEFEKTSHKKGDEK